MFSIHQGPWAKIGSLLGSCILTWVIFTLFPANLDAPSVVTVFTGILFSLEMLIGYKN